MDYTTERSARGGFRFIIQNPPANGTKIIHTDGRVLTFDGIGVAGMLECTDCNGIRSLVFPHQIAGPFVEAVLVTGADLTHL